MQNNRAREFPIYLKIVIFVSLCIFLVSYYYWRVYPLTFKELNIFINNIYKFINTSFLVLLLAAGIVLMTYFIYWIKFKKEGVYIQPFDAGTYSKRYPGRSISDLLIAELERIREVHETNLLGNEQIEQINLAFLSVAPSSENPKYEIANINITGGSFAVALGQVVLILKRLFGHPGNTIAGSLQEYGLKIKLVAWMGPEKIDAWQVEGDEADIPELVRDLAYMIAKDISEETIRAKTWQAFKFFTDALYYYHNYLRTEDKTNLESSKNNCLRTLEYENRYEDVYSLLFNLGTAYEDINNSAISIELFYRIASFKPDLRSSNGWYIKGSAIGKLGKYDVANMLIRYEEALLAFDRAIEIESQSNGTILGKAKCLNAKGIVLFKLAKYEEALLAFDKAIEIEPESDEERSYKAKMLNNKGIVLHKIGKSNKALLSYAEAIKLDDQLDIIWFNKGFAMSHDGKYVEAIYHYNKALKLNPKSDKVWYNRGFALCQTGKEKEAMQSFKKANEINDNSHEIWYNEGIYDRAITLNPKSAKALYCKGIVLSWLHKYEEALNAYDGAIYLDREYAEAWLKKGEAFFALSNYVEALKAYDRSIEISPEETAEDMLELAESWCKKAEALRELGGLDNYLGALYAYDKAIELLPKQEETIEYRNILLGAWQGKKIVFGNLNRRSEAEEANKKVDGILQAMPKSVTGLLE